MKLLSFLRLTLCLVLLFMSSCSSSDKNDSNNNSDEFIIASVETLSFESSDIPNAVTASKIESTDLTTYLVQGFDNAGNAIVLIIADFDGVGTYSFSTDDNDNNASGTFSNQSTAWSSSGGSGGSGTINVITDTDEKTTGTFEFIGVQADMTSSTRTVTSGRYGAKYEK